MREGVRGLSGELTPEAAASELAMFKSRGRLGIITPSLPSSHVPEYHSKTQTVLLIYFVFKLRMIHIT